jgi:glutathione S-transferase
MQLIGMLDSPYVRRVAISLRLLGVPFEHRAVSVFSTFETFQAINPVVKAPSLVCNDGTVLMDSTLILDYAELLATPRLRLMPSGIAERQHALRILGLALAGCEKAVQIVYEKSLRPAEKQHEPWLTRIQGQMLAAFKELELDLTKHSLAHQPILQSGVTVAVVWQFVQAMLPTIAVAQNYPTLAAYSAQAEQLSEFRAFPPTGPGVPTN